VTDKIEVLNKPKKPIHIKKGGLEIWYEPRLDLYGLKVGKGLGGPGFKMWQLTDLKEMIEYVEKDVSK
jgi:hypothetical protein